MNCKTNRSRDAAILETIARKFPDITCESESGSDMLSIIVPAHSVHALIDFLKNDSSMNFHFLTTLCGIHYPDQPLPLGLIYHLHNHPENIRMRIKTFLPSDNPEIATISDLFSTANWMERETWDFYGIKFTGHPKLIRILNVEYLDYFPMRKEYPLEDATREDKDDRFFGR
jgi:NADH-quinone oxidoreductase subunit C